MQPLAFKMLLRKKGTASAIIAIVLLTALVTAVDCLVNNIDSQTTLLTNLAKTGDTYLVVNKNSTSLSDSRIDVALVDQIRSCSNIKYAVFLRSTQATVETNGEGYVASAMGVDNLTAYFRSHKAYVNGSVSQTVSQTNVGIVLANLVHVEKNGKLNVTVNGKTSELQVVGVVQSSAQSDAQLIMPLQTIDGFTESLTSCYIEFYLVDSSQAEQTIANLSRILPAYVKVVSTQQVATFAQDINNQTVHFITVWSVAVYAVVAAAAYVIASRVVVEAETELDTLRTLGAKKRFSSNLILTYVLIIAFMGSVIGLSLGVVGTQAASTFVRWLWGSSLLSPFLELPQVFSVLLFSFAAALLGSLYPAYRAGYGALGGASA